MLASGRAGSARYMEMPAYIPGMSVRIEPLARRHVMPGMALHPAILLSILSAALIYGPSAASASPGVRGGE
jgi:hypothetical protein